MEADDRKKPFFPSIIEWLLSSHSGPNADSLQTAQFQNKAAVSGDRLLSASSGDGVNGENWWLTAISADL
jgi:hypothetical protein